MYELAFHLRMPVYEVVEMPYDEFVGWFAYFKVRPIGWREDSRTMKLLQVQGVKERPSAIFPSLTIHDEPKSSVSTLKGSFLYHKMLSAKGGDKIL